MKKGGGGGGGGHLNCFFLTDLSTKIQTEHSSQWVGGGGGGGGGGLVSLDHQI